MLGCNAGQGGKPRETEADLRKIIPFNRSYRYSPMERARGHRLTLLIFSCWIIIDGIPRQLEGSPEGGTPSGLQEGQDIRPAHKGIAP